MAGTVKSGPQDLPPEGGYAPFHYERSKLRTIIGGRLGTALFYGISLGGFYLYFLNLRDVRKSQIEMRSSRFAITPLLEAERDRALIKHMKRVRDEEADLMKDVEGWEVGTLYGTPIFYQERPEYFEPRPTDAYVFSDPNDFVNRLFRIAYL
nr:PREDICTED: NADH dehydrogenase [ubiquinone] 1 alpha subcomplex subunit 13 [Megachile rotundata]